MAKKKLRNKRRDMRRTFGLDPTRILAPAGEVVDDVVAKLAPVPGVQGPARRARVKSVDFET